MSEIKSTLDLVLERTAGLSLSPEEKARQEAEELDRQAQGLAARLSNGGLRSRELRAELDLRPPAERAALARAAAGRLVDLIDFNQAEIDPRLRETLEILLGEAAEPVWRELNLARREYLASLAREESRDTERLRSELAARGFSGSALRPKPKAELDQRPFKAGVKRRLA